MRIGPFYSLSLLALISIGTPKGFSQPVPTVAPGLTIPSGNLPWALDRFEGRSELVPIHHSTIEVNNHKGANVAGSLGGSFFYKPKMTTELAGPHARTTLHDPSAPIYLHFQRDTDNAGDSANSETTTWALVQAVVSKDRRVFAKVRFTQLTGNAKREDGVVETTQEMLPGDWLKLTPKAPLVPGEYAITPVPKSQNAFSTIVYDFTLDPAAPNAADAVHPQAIR